MSIRSTQVWVAAFVIVVFACGLAAGALLGPRFGPGGQSGFDRRPAGMGFPSPGSRGPRLVERIVEELALSEEQRTELEEVFTARRDRFRAINEEVRARFDTERGDMRAALEEILTAEQLEQLDEEILRFRADRRGRRGGEAGAGGRGGLGRRGPDR